MPQTRPGTPEGEWEPASGPAPAPHLQQCPGISLHAGEAGEHSPGCGKILPSCLSPTNSDVFLGPRFLWNGRVLLPQGEFPGLVSQGFPSISPSRPPSLLRTTWLTRRWRRWEQLVTRKWRKLTVSWENDEYLEQKTFCTFNNKQHSWQLEH